MASLPQKLAQRWLASAVTLNITLFLAVTAGCVSTEPLLTSSKAPPTGPVCQVMATWNSEVMVTPDPTHGGQSTPGIAGRLYLFGPEIGTPLIGEGSAVVDLYDMTEGGDGKLIEEWRIDKDTLRRLKRRDTIGWGYTLFLPWGTYKPGITQVQLKLRYETGKGAPIYAASEPMTLNRPGGAGFTAVSRHVVPGASPKEQTLSARHD